MKQRILAVALGASFLLAPTAFGEGSFDHAQYAGFAGYDWGMRYFALRLGGAYLEEGGVPSRGTRSKSDNFSDKGESEITFTPGEVDWSAEGLDPEGGAGDLSGSMSTKNGKVFKLFMDTEGPEDANLRSWIATFAVGNGGTPVSLTKAKFRGKAKIGKDGSVNLAIKISYLGTQSGGQNFGAKAKGKMTWKAVLTGDDPV